MQTHYAVGVPSRKFSDLEFQQLLTIIAYSADRLKPALGTRNLIVVHLQDRLWFPWFTRRGFYGETADFSYLVDGICNLAKIYPYCSTRTYIRREVQWLLWEIGLDVPPSAYDLPHFSGFAVLSDWYSRIAQKLSDICTRLFRRTE